MSGEPQSPGGFPGVGTNFLTAGHELVLLEPDGPSATPDQLATLVATLVQRRFLRSAVRIGERGLAETLAWSARASGLGLDVSLEWPGGAEPLFSPRPLAALVSCEPNAHLALAVVAERRTAFHAWALGRVVSEGFVIRVNGVEALRRPN